MGGQVADDIQEDGARGDCQCDRQRPGGQAPRRPCLSSSEESHAEDRTRRHPNEVQLRQEADGDGAADRDSEHRAQAAPEATRETVEQCG